MVGDNQEFFSESQVRDILELLLTIKNPKSIKAQIIALYGDGKRHQYSLITSYIMKQIAPEKDFQEKLSIICDNLRNLVEILNDNKCQKSLQKLYDHINLELVRLNYTKELENDLQESKRQLDEIKSQSQAIKSDIKKQQAQYITILGIFASIVLAFVGGFTFSTSVLANMHQVGIYRLVFVLCFIAFFIANILHFLFSFIKDINQTQKPRFYQQGIFYFNVFIILFLLILFVSYCAHI